MIDSQPPSKFNAALAKLERVGTLREKAHNARHQKDYYTWFTCLQSIRSEINEKFKKEDEAIADNFEELINASMKVGYNKFIATPFYTSKPKINYEQIFFLLNKYELHLGKLEGKFHIGLVSKDDPRWAATGN